jgi:phosphomethylpyrimidine synthase
VWTSTGAGALLDKTPSKEAHKARRISARWKISQDLRDGAAAIEAREKGMAEMSEKFKEMGGKIYVRSDTSNQGLI